MKSEFKKVIFIIVPIIFIAFSFINKKFFKSNFKLQDDVYVNELSKRIDNNEIADIDYDFIKKDFDQIDIILKEQIAEETDKKKKTVVLNIASEIYKNKMNELCKILTDKLNDFDFERLMTSIDEFNKNLEFALLDIDNKIESSVDSEYYKSKYQYEERMNLCHSLLETYKGFLDKEKN